MFWAFRSFWQLCCVLYTKRASLVQGNNPRVQARYGSLSKLFRRPHFGFALFQLAKRLLIVVVSLFASRVHVFLLTATSP